MGPTGRQTVVVPPCPLGRSVLADGRGGEGHAFLVGPASRWHSVDQGRSFPLERGTARARGWTIGRRRNGTWRLRLGKRRKAGPVQTWSVKPTERPASSSIFNLGLLLKYLCCQEESDKLRWQIFPIYYLISPSEEKKNVSLYSTTRLSFYGAWYY